MRSPTARTLNFLRERDSIAEVVERYNSYSHRYKDLFDCIDIICITGAKLMGIQCTSGANHAARIDKAMASDKLAAYLNTGNGFEVWSWSQRVTRNKDGSKSKVKRWTPRVTQLIEMDGKVKVL